MVWEEGGYGLISWKQDVEFYRHTNLSFLNPDWELLARSFGWQVHRISGSRDVATVLETALAESGPSLVVMQVDYEENIKLTQKLNAMAKPVSGLTA